MKKYLLPLFTLLFLSCAKNDILTDLKKIGLKGNVKKIRFYHVPSNDDTEKGEIYDEEELTIDNEYYFNENGMITKKIEYYSNKLNWKYLFKYDEKNLLIFKNQYNSNGELVARSKYENIIDNNGKLNKQNEFITLEKPPLDTIDTKFRKFPEKTTEYFYDVNGNITQINEYQSSVPFWKHITDYEEGNMSKYSTLEISNDSLILSEKFNCLTFDSKLNCIEYNIIDKEKNETLVKAEIEYFE